MPEDFDELIREIAYKHGMPVSRDDPILILQTINKRLMEDSHAAHQLLLNEYRQTLEDISRRWSLETKESAATMHNAALSATKEVLGSTFEKEINRLKNELQKVADEVEKPTSTIRKLTIICSIACLLSVAASMGTILILVV